MRTLSNTQWAVVQFIATGLGLLLASCILVANAQEPTTTEGNYGPLSQSPTVNYSEHPVTYTTADMLLKWSEDFEAATPPGFEDFYDKDYYGPAQIYCTNGYDFDIWIVTKDGAVTVPAKGHFVLTKKGD